MGHRVSGIGPRVVQLALAALMTAGCTVPLLQSRNTASGIFVVALDSPVLTLDPALVTDLSSARVTSQVYETLVEYNPESGGVEPLLAQSWAVSGDGRVWTFTLRSGVTFHDGTPLTSDAVVENITRWMDTSSPYHRGDFDYWQILFGGFKGSGSLVRSVERVDDLRFRLTLEQPHSPLLAALSMFPFAIVSPTAMHSDVDKLRLQPVGSGPFRFAERKGDSEFTLSANERYWGAKPKLAAVRFVVLSDGAARLNALRDGKAHLIEGSDAATLTSARRLPGVRILFRPSRTVVSLSINQKAAPFEDRRVRQAIAHAIDRQALIERVYGGRAQAAEQFVLPGLAGHDRSLGPLTYNSSTARQLLSDAGYGGGMMTQIWYPATPRAFLPDPRALAEAIADDLRVIGIVAVANSADWPTYQRRSLEGGFPLYLQAWTGDSPDADSYLSGLFASDAAARSIGYSNPELKTVLTTARAEGDAAQRAALYKQAAAIVRNDMPRFPLVQPQSPLLLAGSVKGFTPSLLGVESYRGVSLGQ